MSEKTMPAEPEFTTSKHLDEVDQIVAACLERPPDERAVAVDKATTSHPEYAVELRERFQFLEQSGLLDVQSASASIPERLGEFRLIRRLGGGGMGVVYLAEQESLGREVALKMIRPEHLYFTDSRERFRREVEAVGRLEHPGIVRVYSVGEESGVPYFAMERIRGCSLAELIAGLRDVPIHELDGRRLAEQFTRITELESPVFAMGQSWPTACLLIVKQVAEALQHAHEHGILHRDLKLSNVMLTADGRAQLVDFGLASQADTPKLTRTGSLIGSLAYMSPEHIRGDALDARTDVYSLGVLLYELLTLCMPFSGSTTTKLSQRILAGVPLPIRQRNRGVPADVATVCMVAMDLAKQRRYRSAQAFGEDIARCLEHRPIVARPLNMALRAYRWVQRHPTSSTALGLGALLFVGLPTGLYVNEVAARVAIAEEADAANSSVAFLIATFAEFMPANARGRPLDPKKLLALGVQRLRTDYFAKPRIQGRLLVALAEIHSGLGLHAEAAELARECMDLHQRHPDLPRRGLARAHMALGEALDRLGEYADAEVEFRTGLALQREVTGDDHPDTARHMVALGSFLRYFGKRDEAEELLRDALEIHRTSEAGEDMDVVRTMFALALLLTMEQRHADAEPEMRAVLERLEQLGKTDHPLYANAHHTLAAIEVRLHRHEDARRHFEEAIALLERLHGLDSDRLARPLEDYGALLLDLGELEGAETALQRALAVRSSDTPAQPGIARSLNQLGCLHIQRGRHAEALRLLERSVELYREVFPDGHRDLGVALGNLAQAKTELGDHSGAADDARAAVTVHREFGQAPTYFEATALSRVARAEYSQGNSRAGLEHAQQAVDMCRGLTPKDHEHAAMCLNALALLLLREGRGAEAEPLSREAAAMLERLVPAGNAELAGIVHTVGWAREQQGDLDGAEELFLRALGLFRKYVPDGNGYVAYTLNALGVCEYRRQAWHQARPHFAEALKIRSRMLPEQDPLLSESHNNLGITLGHCGELAQGEFHLRRAAGLRLTHLPAPHINTASSVRALADVLLEAGRAAEAVTQYEASLTIQKALPAAMVSQMRDTTERRLKKARAAAAEQADKDR